MVSAIMNCSTAQRFRSAKVMKSDVQDHTHDHDHSTCNHDHGHPHGKKEQTNNHLWPIAGGIAALAGLGWLIYYYFFKQNPAEGQLNSVSTPERQQ